MDKIKMYLVDYEENEKSYTFYVDYKESRYVFLGTIDKEDGILKLEDLQNIYLREDKDNVKLNELFRSYLAKQKHNVKELQKKEYTIDVFDYEWKTYSAYNFDEGYNINDSTFDVLNVEEVFDKNSHLEVLLKTKNEYGYNYRRYYEKTAFGSYIRY